jgi:hypothetical protein
MPIKQRTKITDWIPDEDTGYRLTMVIDDWSSRDVQCGYCLYIGKFKEFFLPNKKNPAKHLEKTFQCPDCKVIQRSAVLFRTLDMPISEYAKWIYSVRQFDVDRRIKWDKIKARLLEKNLTGLFWDAYYKAKDKALEDNVEYQTAKYEKEQEAAQT